MKKPQIVRGKRRDAYWEFQENMQMFPNSRCSSLPVLGITDSSKKIKIQNEALQLTSKWLCISLAPSCHHTRQQIGEFWMFSVDHRGSIGSSNRSAPAIHDNAANTREFDWIWVIGERPLYYFHNTTYDKRAVVGTKANVLIKGKANFNLLSVIIYHGQCAEWPVILPQGNKSPIRVHLSQGSRSIEALINYLADSINKAHLGGVHGWHFVMRMLWEVNNLFNFFYLF